MPELASKIIPPIRTLDPDINRVVKEFAGNFKTRHVQAHPDDGRNSGAKVNDSLDTIGAVVQN